MTEEAKRGARRGTMSDIAALAGKQAARKKPDGAGFMPADEIAMLMPSREIVDTIAGTQITFRCPKPGRFIQALPYFQPVFDCALGDGGKIPSLSGEEAGASLGEFIIGVLLSRSPLAMAAGLNGICKTLDIFLGQESGWHQDNWELEDVFRAFRNYMQVIPVGAFHRFFCEAGAALAGHAKALGTDAATPAARG